MKLRSKSSNCPNRLKRFHNFICFLRRDILLLQNHFMKEQLHRMALDNEKLSYITDPLLESFENSKAIIENLESVKDVQVN